MARAKRECGVVAGLRRCGWTMERLFGEGVWVLRIVSVLRLAFRGRYWAGPVHVPLVKFRVDYILSRESRLVGFNFG
jgi:hypothetical protein